MYHRLLIAMSIGSCLISDVCVRDASFLFPRRLNLKVRIQCLFDDQLRARLKVPFWVKDEGQQGDIGNTNLCSCCGAPMKVKSCLQKVPSFVFSSNASRVSQAPTPSPRAAFPPLKSDVDSRAFDLPSARYTDLKLSDNSTPDDEESGNVPIPGSAKVSSILMEKTQLMENDDLLEDTRTPSFNRNRFFGIALDSPSCSPRWAQRAPRKSMLERVELASDPVDMGGPNESEDSLLNRLKRQVRLDRKMLVALNMELDEERAASAIAANNAMAMITRLQADKAAVQMEALQYQRMMEEQAEYAQEDLQSMNEEMRELQEELDIYRARFGPLMEVMRDNNLRCDSFSSFTERSDQGSPQSAIHTGTDVVHEIKHASSEKASSSHEENDEPGKIDDDSSPIDDDSSPIDFDYERSYLLGQLRMMESRLNASADNRGDKDNQGEKVAAEASDASILIEVSQLGAKLRALEADNESLKQALVTLQGDESEGSRLFAEIAEHLKKLRQVDTVIEDGSSLDFERERSSLLDRLTVVESKLHTLEDNRTDEDNKESERADGSNDSIANEVSQLSEMLKVLEADSRFIQHAVLILQKGGDESNDLLKEIAEQLQKFHNVQKMQSEPVVSPSEQSV